MRDLNRYVVHKYASEWDEIAIELGLGGKLLKGIMEGV